MTIKVLSQKASVSLSWFCDTHRVDDYAVKGFQSSYPGTLFSRDSLPVIICKHNVDIWEPFDIDPVLKELAVIENEMD